MILPPGQIRASSLMSANALNRPGSRGQRNYRPADAAVDTQSIPVTRTATPRVIGKHRPAVNPAPLMGEQFVGRCVDELQISYTLPKLVVNNNNNVSHAPGGSIVNNNYNETHLSMQDPSSDVALIIEKGAHKAISITDLSTDTSQAWASTTFLAHSTRHSRPMPDVWKVLVFRSSTT